MNCRYSQNEIALYVEQDLPAAASREIELHLSTCGACRDLAGDLRETQAILKGLKQDTVSPAALSSVRNRVLAEIGRAPVRPVWGRWIYAMAGGLLVVVMSVIWIVTHRVEKQIAEREVASPVKEAVVESEPTVDHEVLHEVRHNAQSVGVGLSRSRARSKSPAEVGTSSEPVDSPPKLADAPEPSNQVMVKLLTDDPNVVIYWLVDQKNGGTL